MGNGSAGAAPCNGTAPPPPPPPPPAGHNIAALVLGIVLILLIVGGNGLVCLSVCTERALKTTTNYFIVSLAVADLLLALLVLPLYVYSEVRDARGAAGGTGRFCPPCWHPGPLEVTAGGSAQGRVLPLVLAAPGAPKPQGPETQCPKCPKLLKSQAPNAPIPEFPKPQCPGISSPGSRCTVSIPICHQPTFKKSSHAMFWLL